MHVGITLVSLALGYVVLVSASKEKEGMKVLGQAIGILVILGSLAGFLCGVTMKCLKKGYCPSQGAMTCPMGDARGVSK